MSKISLSELSPHALNLSPAGKPWKTESSQLGAEEAGYLSPGPTHQAEGCFSGR